MNKTKYVVDLETKAHVVTRVIVEAESEDEAEEIARQVEFNPRNVLDRSGADLKRFNDLVWDLDELDKDGVIQVIGSARPMRD